MTNPKATPPKPKPPPPSIVHLLLWTAGSALLLLFFRRMDAIIVYPESWQSFHQVSQVPQSMIYGAALASFSMFYFYGRRGLPYPRHPGHWLLLRMGLGITISWILFELFPHAEDGDYDYSRLRTITYEAVETALGTLIFLIAAVTLLLRRDILWSLVFLAAVPMAMLNFIVWLILLNVLSGSSNVNSPGLFHLLLANATVPQLGVLAARVVDFLTGTRRDWVHLTGVYCFLLITLVAWSWHIWMFVS